MICIVINLLNFYFQKRPDSVGAAVQDHEIAKARSMTDAVQRMRLNHINDYYKERIRKLSRNLAAPQQTAAETSEEEENFEEEESQKEV